MQAPVIDHDALMARTGGDHALLQEMALVFEEMLAEDWEAIHAAMAASDGPALQKAAHRLKGAIGNFSTQGAYQAALALEQTGRHGHWQAAEEGLQTLQAEVSQLVVALRALVQG